MRVIDFLTHEVEIDGEKYLILIDEIVNVVLSRHGYIDIIYKNKSFTRLPYIDGLFPDLKDDERMELAEKTYSFIKIKLEQFKLFFYFEKEN